MIHAKFDNPLNDNMALMRAARKAEGQHEQEKHTTSSGSRSGVISKGQSHQDGMPAMTLGILHRNPGLNGLKCKNS